MSKISVLQVVMLSIVIFPNLVCCSLADYCATLKKAGMYTRISVTDGCVVCLHASKLWSWYASGGCGVVRCAH